MTLHFVGFRGDEYMRAVRLFGRPDHVWERATWTLMGSIPGSDTVILGPYAFQIPRKWRNAYGAAHNVKGV